MGELSLLSIIILLGAMQGVFLGIAVARRKIGNRRASTILAIFVLLIAIVLLSRLIYTEGGNIWRTYPHLFLIPDVPLLMYAPLFYLYLRQLLAGPETTVRMWPHFLPAVLHTLIISVYLFESPSEYLHRILAGNLIEVPYIAYLSLAQMAVYLFFAYRLLSRYRDQRSDQRANAPRWIYLRAFFWAVSACWLLWFYSLLSSAVPVLPVVEMLDYNVSWVALSFTSYLLAYFAISTPDAFTFTKEPEKYQGSLLTPEQLAALQDDLDRLMAERKPYLNSTLTLADLAELLNVSPKDLSRVINEKHGMNFFDFINLHRVHEFERLAKLEANRHLTTLALAYEAGFNAKTTFYTAFRKMHGQSPARYLKAHTESD